MEREKYIEHRSGVPIRIPPYLRRELASGRADLAGIQLNLMIASTVIGERGANDVMPHNVESNLFLRRKAHVISKDLVGVAREIGAQRFCTIVHGSVARGLARHPESPDPSDLDIDLVVDCDVPRALRRACRYLIYKMPSVYGARIDTYVWSREDMMRLKAENARRYLSAGAYAVANEGQLWEEIRGAGLVTQAFLSYGKLERKDLLKRLDLLCGGQFEQCVIGMGSVQENFFRMFGLLVNQESIPKAMAIRECIVNSG